MTETAMTPLAKALERRANERQVHAVLTAIGITERCMSAYVAGTQRPVPWIAREIAAALKRDVDDLFPPRPRRDDND